jgi:hypothetical protein
MIASITGRTRSLFFQSAERYSYYVGAPFLARRAKNEAQKKMKYLAAAGKNGVGQHIRVHRIANRNRI